MHSCCLFQADQQIQKILEQPIVFNLVQGEISQAKISKSEPQWSVNFKKALALLFQTKVDAASWKPEENQVKIWLTLQFKTFYSLYILAQ